MELTVRYGGRQGKAFRFITSSDHLVVRAVLGHPVLERRVFESASLSPRARLVLDQFDLVFRLPAFGVEVLRVRASAPDRTRDRARRVLKTQPSIDFAGRVLLDKESMRPVVYTERMFIKFEDSVAATKARRIMKAAGLQRPRPAGYAHNAYVAWAGRDAGTAVFTIANNLLDDPAVALCHPEILREARRREVFPGQWHLKKMSINNRSIDQSANVEAAWKTATGEGVVIAIIDDGVDVDHEEFSPKKTKIVAPRDVMVDSSDPRPGNSDNHGTACAGVACANGTHGASGVAPGAKLMPIRLAAVLGAQEEADAFQWAADHGADVISCSWGPVDGPWWNPDDPLHQQVAALPDSTRLAMEYATTKGRDGKGCVLLFAAGNGNESAENDGYASHPNVIAVAACSDRGTRSGYSDYGKNVWCSFPSDNVNDPLPLTTGIWTTDRTGPAGYNLGDEARGDSTGNYTNSFGGTSSAAPGAAGVAALVLSANRELSREEVRDILRNACVQIDVDNGRYSEDGHSSWYGYGRLDAEKAVTLALEAKKGSTR